MIAQRLRLKLSAESSATTETIPADLTGLPWALIQGACLPAGYDLSPHVGQTVRLTTYRFVDPPKDRPSGLAVIERDGVIIGAYTFTDDVVPGISSLGVDQTP